MLRFGLWPFVSVCVSLAAETPPPAPGWSSIPARWQGEAFAKREWTDDQGQPQRLDLCRRRDGVAFYVLHALSAVCGDAGRESSCKIHRFEACFDEIGRFQGFRVDSAQPFTRARHEPFARKDYERLDRIARDPVHVLGSLGAQADGVDAVSGATIAYLTEQSVPGAFYTSRAVWIVAQKSGPERVQAWTLERLREADVKAWRAQGETLKLWWFLDHADRSPLPDGVKADIAYGLLSGTPPEVQAAAIRFLRRAGAAFRAGQSMGDTYAELDDAVKPEFLAWWQSHRHATKGLVAAILDDLLSRAEASSPVTVPALDYLEALDAVASDRARKVLETLADKTPSTFVRGKVRKLLGSDRRP